MGLLNESARKSVIRWLERNRGLVVLLFCLPASFIFDIALRAKIWLERKLTLTPGTHEERVAQIQAQVRKLNFNLNLLTQQHTPKT